MHRLCSHGQRLIQHRVRPGPASLFGRGQHHLRPLLRPHRIPSHSIAHHHTKRKSPPVSFSQIAKKSTLGNAQENTTSMHSRPPGTATEELHRGLGQCREYWMRLFHGKTGVPLRKGRWRREERRHRIQVVHEGLRAWSSTLAVHTGSSLPEWHWSPNRPCESRQATEAAQWINHPDRAPSHQQHPRPARSCFGCQGVFHPGREEQRRVTGSSWSMLPRWHRSPQESPRSILQLPKGGRSEEPHWLLRVWNAATSMAFMSTRTRPGASNGLSSQPMVVWPVLGMALAPSTMTVSASSETATLQYHGSRKPSIKDIRAHSTTSPVRTLRMMV
ncbi:uncharacterized protein BJ171DRAFT_42215 [Polychytrium aggregatum]|uniref:uncharacterized protein n=1 Tax=Polychytrium aggregatum TaxID=110093 RepID=UPI0022FE15C2|nr:uncharacterized protein BJ171DRAFT_42215 [Polychytrium aggregatum]KAI9206163.1 hypothetical protein BJ171DRAFT_42215 [Polychytrium aggregatum]